MFIELTGLCLGLPVTVVVDRITHLTPTHHGGSSSFVCCGDAQFSVAESVEQIKAKIREARSPDAIATILESMASQIECISKNVSQIETNTHDYSRE